MLMRRAAVRLIVELLAETDMRSPFSFQFPIEGIYVFM